MFFVGNSGAEVYFTCTAIRLTFIRAKDQVDMVRNEKSSSVNYSLCCLRYGSWVGSEYPTSYRPVLAS
jgi:hypothetical protein